MGENATLWRSNQNFLKSNYQKSKNLCYFDIILCLKGANLFKFKGKTMAQATFSIRMEESLKKKFDSLCNEFGMNATTAINIFAKAVVRERKIPFEITAGNGANEALIAFNSLREQAVKNGVADMSLEEINAEIKQTRKEKRK